MRPNSESDLRSPQIPSASVRDGFLDAIRAIATTRVILWHAFGFSLISWFVASIPAMFFVFGSLLAASLERRSWWAVAKDRFERVLIPLWGFTLLTWSAILIAGKSDDFPIWRFVTWIAPVVDPQYLSWEGGWLSSPLWFLRMLTWLLLLSPLLFFAVSRRPFISAFVLVTFVFASDVVARHPNLIVEAIPTLWWKLGDVALYGGFVTAGILHNQGVFKSISKKQWIIVATSTGVAALVWRFTQPVPLGVVNNSHPLHMLVGIAWLSLAFAFREYISNLACRPIFSSYVRFATRRSMTIYLWHTTVIAGILWLLAKLNLDLGFARPVVYLVLIATGVYVVTLTVGWIEDLAARRRPSLHGIQLMKSIQAKWQTAIALIVAMFAMAGTGNLVAAGTSTESIHRPPPIPSQQPPRPEFVTQLGLPNVVPVAESQLNGALEKAIKTWMKSNGAAGVQVQLLDANGRNWSAVAGTQVDEKTSVKQTDSFDMASITKLMTATLIYRAADEGRIDLDAPLPHLDALPDFPYRDMLTPRLLLSHQSGLVNYRDTTRYMSDKSLVTTPQDAVNASSGEPLGFQPGEKRSYSSVNYLLLGFLIEQTYGETYEDVALHELMQPLGLASTFMLASAPGEPNYSTGGTLTTMADLVHMTYRILRDRALLSPESYAAMTSIDPEYALGAGTIGFCPCTLKESGKSFYSLGHYGSDSLVIYVPTLDVVVGLRVTDGLHSEGRLDKSIDLATHLGQLVAVSTRGL